MTGLLRITSDRTNHKGLDAHILQVKKSGKIDGKKVLLLTEIFLLVNF